MKQLLSRLMLLALAALLPATASADSYDDAHKIFRNAGESAAYFGNAYGYALFPTIGKGGIGIGGAYGEGRVSPGQAGGPCQRIGKLGSVHSRDSPPSLRPSWFR